MITQLQSCMEKKEETYPGISCSKLPEKRNAQARDQGEKKMRSLNASALCPPFFAHLRCIAAFFENIQLAGFTQPARAKFFFDIRKWLNTAAAAFEPSLHQNYAGFLIWRERK